MKSCVLATKDVYKRQILGEHGRATGREKDARHQIENVVRTIAEHDALHADARPLGQRLFQQEAVRVARQVRHRLFRSGTRFRAHAERIFVGRQLDDLVDCEPISRANWVIGLPGW